MANSSLDLEDLREWLRESAQEFDRRSQEFEQRSREINERFDKQSQEFNERFDKQSQEFNERFDKQSQEFEKTRQEIQRLSDLHTTQWGRLMEASLGQEGLVRIQNDEKFQPRDFRRKLENSET